MSALRYFLVVSNIEEAEEDMNDLNTFLNGPLAYFPTCENIFSQSFEDEGDIHAQRLNILNQTLHSNIQTGNNLGYYRSSHPGSFTVCAFPNPFLTIS